MTDCDVYKQTPYCCFRKHSTHSEVLEDGMHMNIVLALFYFGSYFLGLQQVCFASFIALLLNSIFMCELFQNISLKLSELEVEDDAEIESEPESEPESELSIKQREHGATVSKCLTKEEDTVLYQQLQKIVNETQNRNNNRANILLRTPTSSSLTDPTSEDEYADMPPLISAAIYTDSMLRNRRANFFDYNKKKENNIQISDMDNVD